MTAVGAPRLPAAVPAIRSPVSEETGLARQVTRSWLGARARLLRTVLTLAVMAMGWEWLAPPAVGGATSVVVTSGISMLPNFHAGDLVLLRSEASYHVGEVAGYHNAQLGEVVMHRIKAVHDGRYVFKGDNNDFTDSYQPTASQIVGAEWVHLPGAGHLLNDLRMPGVAAAVCAALWLLSFRSRPATRRRRRRHRHAG